MLKLKLELVIVPHRGNIVMKTGLRIFDKRSYFSVYSAIVNGALGRHSKSSFYLTGLVRDEEPTLSKDWEEVPYWRVKDDGSLGSVRANRKLASNPGGFESYDLTWYLNMIQQGHAELPERSTEGEWSVIFHPFFRKVEGELYLFLSRRVRTLMGITHRDTDFHVFMQNYGIHLPILP